jgi:site-specific DNA-methyltransferase (adenine-specific)
MVTLIPGDCLEVLRFLEPNSISLVLSDLPYEITQNEWDKMIPIKPLWEEWKRVCKPNAAIVLTASQPFTSYLVASSYEAFRHEYIWVKNKASGHLNAKRAPMRNHESVLVFSFETPVYNPQMTASHNPVNAYYTSNKNNSSNYGKSKITAGGGSTLRYPKTILPFDVVNNDDPARIHPNQKPVALMEYIVRTYSSEGDTVLDVCMGSGSTGIACMNTKRNFIGIENDPNYFALAKARIDAYQR